MSLTEIIVVIILVLVVMGPEKIPEMMRWVGKGMREIRRATNLFRDTMMIEGDGSLPDELDPGTPGPLDVPEAGGSETDSADDGTDTRSDGNGPGAQMHLVDLEPSKALRDHRTVALEAARSTDQLRVRYLSPPHRNLF